MSEYKKKNYRKIAEEQVDMGDFDASRLSVEEINRLFHELKVHQIELEMQNEELRETQESLQRTQKEFFKLYHFAPFGYVRLDENGVIQQANLAFGALVHQDLNKIMNKHLFRLVSKENQGRFISWFMKLKEDKPAKPIQVALVNSEDSPVHVQIQAEQWKHGDSPSKDKKNGKHVLLSLMDISENWEIQQQLEENLNYLNAAIEVGNIAWWQFDVPTGEITFHPKKTEMLGYNYEDFKGKTYSVFTDLLHPDDYEATMQAMRDYVEGKAHAYLTEYRIRAADGSYRWFYDFGQGTDYSPNGVLKTITGIVVDITDRKEAQINLGKSEQNYRLLAEQTHDLVCMHENDGTYVYVSPSSRNILGYEPQELIGKNPYDFFHPDDSERIQRESHDIMLEKSVATSIIYRFRKKNDEYIWLETANTPVLDDKGDLVKLVTSSRDVSQRLKIEREQRDDRLLLNSVFDAIQDGMLVMSTDLKILKTNRKMREWIGRDVVGTQCMDGLSHCVDSCENCQAAEVMQTGSPSHRQRKLTLDNVGERIMNVYAAPFFDEHGMPHGIVQYYEDITERLEAEHKEKEAEERFRQIFDQANDGILVATTSDKRFVMANKTVCNLLGYTEEEILKLGVMDIHPKEDLAYVIEQFEKQAEKEFRLAENLPVQRKDGSVFYADVNSSPIIIGGKEYLLGIFRDNTERKESQERIKYSEERLLMALDASNEGLWDWDLTTNETYFSPRYYTMLGYEPGEFPSSLESWRNLVHPDDVDFVLKDAEAHITALKPYSIEFRMLHKDGEYRWIEGKGKVVSKDDQGRPIRVVGTHLDISKRKRTEEAIKRSEAMLLDSQRIAHLGSWELDMATNNLIWSDEVYRIFGLKPQEFAATYEAFLDAIHPEDREVVNEMYTSSVKEGRNSYEITHRVVRKKTNEIRYVHERCRHIRDDKGNLIRSVGMVHDITERKAAEKKLKDRETKYRSTLELAADAIITIDSTGIILEFNKTAEQYFGYTRDEIMGQNVNILVPEPHHSKHDAYIKEHVEKNLSGVIGSPVEVQAIRKDKTRFPIDISVTEVNLEGKKLFTGIIRDITERKQYERDTTRLGRILDSSLNEVFIFNSTDLNFIQVSNGAINNLGYSMEEMKKLTPIDIKPKYTEKEFRKLIEPLLQGEKDQLIYETVHRRKNGTDYPVDTRLQLSKKEDPPVFIATVQDITNRKEAERLLKESEERYRLSQQASGVGSWEFNLKTEVVTWAPEVYTIFGLDYNTFQVTYESYLGLVHPDDIPKLQNSIEVILNSGKDYEIEHRIITPDGSLRWLYSSGDVLVDEDGTPEKLVGVVIDITDRKLVEQALAESEEKSRLLLESAGEGIYGLDLEGKTTFVNPAAQRMLGYSEEEIIGQPMHQLIHHSYPDGSSYPREKCPMYAAFTDGTIHKVDDEVLWRKDGTSFEVQYISTPIVKDGASLGAVVTFQDISSRKQTEEALKASEKWFSTTLHSIGDAVVATDINMRVTYMNQIAQNLTGRTLEDSVGNEIQYVMDLVNSKDRSLVINPVAIALEKMNSVELQDNTLLIRKDGLEVPIDDSAAPIISEDGELLGAVMVFRDITKRKESEAELLKAKEAAESGSRAKSAFLANMSHELRTPLNAVIGLSQVLQEDYFGTLTEKQAEYVANILSSGQHLLKLINDILDLSKIEAGGMELDIYKVDIYPLVADSQSIISQKAVVHSIDLVFDAPKEMEDVTIEADETKLKQVLYNLLSNAAKFTPDGGSITTSLRKKDDCIQISVADTGIGIDPKHHKKIFDPFYQVKGEYQKKITGTGLGMSLCNQMVKLHGGKIWLESEGEGKGTTFFFTIPLTQKQCRKNV